MIGPNPEFNPLGPDALATANALCEQCPAYRDFLLKAKAAGHPVDKHLQTVDAAEQYARAVKQHFFPGHP